VLLHELAGVARQAGNNGLIAEVLSSNLAMLKVFETSGLQVKKRREGHSRDAQVCVGPSAIERASQALAAAIELRGSTTCCGS
jgi:hypothetical protein